MRPKSLVLLGLALGCGLIASIGISQVLDKNGSAPEKTEPIYVAKVDINLGDLITAEVVNLEQWPVDKIPVGAIRELEEYEGQRVKGKIFAGEPVLEARVGASADATDTIPEGYNVVPVQLGKAEIGAGLLHPGNRVDIQWFVQANPELGIQQTTTKKILYNVRVFAVDQQFERSAEDGEPSIGSIISLLVTPEDADKLALAQKLGEIKIILKNNDDTVSEQTPGATINDLFNRSSEGDAEKERGNSQTASTSDDESRTSAFMKFMEKAKEIAANASTAVAANTPKEKAWVVEVIEAEVVRHDYFDSQGRRMAADAEMEFEVSKSDSNEDGSNSDEESKGFENVEDSDFETGEEDYTEPSGRYSD